MFTSEVEAALNQAREAEQVLGAGQHQIAEGTRQQTVAEYVINRMLETRVEALAPPSGPGCLGINRIEIGIEDYMFLAYGAKLAGGYEPEAERLKGQFSYLSNQLEQPYVVFDRDDNVCWLETGILAAEAPRFELETNNVWTQLPDSWARTYFREYARPLFVTDVTRRVKATFDSFDRFGPNLWAPGGANTPTSRRLVIDGWCDLGQRPLDARHTDIAVGEDDIETLIEARDQDFPDNLVLRAWEHIQDEGHTVLPGGQFRSK